MRQSMSSASPETLPRGSRRAFWAAMLIGQVVLLLILLEIGIRLAAAYSSGVRLLLYLPSIRHEYEEIDDLPSLMEKTALGFNPGSVYAGFVLNARGFRSPDYELKKRPGTRRIVFLGDSFTFASGQLPYSLSWVARTGERLTAMTGVETEVISLSAPGVGPLFESRLWALEGEALEPDVAVLGFYVGNDFSGEQGSWSELERANPLIEYCYTARLARNLARVLADRNALRTLATADRRRSEDTGTEDPAYLARYDPMEPSIETERFEEMAAGRLRVYTKKSRETLDRLARAIEPSIRAMALSARSIGTRFAIVMIPDEVQVDPDLLARARERIGAAPDALDLTAPQDRLHAICIDLDIECIDLLPAFQARGRIEKLYRLQDTHWNPAGNQLAAEIIADRLSE